MLIIDCESMIDFYSGFLFLEGVMFMRSVHDYFKELDREKLIENYLEYSTNDNDKIFNLPDYTEEQQKKWKYRELDKFIQYLIDKDITEIENGKTYILFEYPNRVISTDEMNDEYLLNCEDNTDNFISVLNGIIFMWFIAFIVFSLKQFSMIFFAIVVWIIMLIYNTIWYLKKRKSDGEK